MKILAIALNTFREAVRDKLLYLLLVLAVALILISRAVGWVSYGGERKIMTDLGLLAVWLFSGIVAIFIGAGMIHKEVDKRTLYTILSKPVRRWEFILGKYAGLLLTVLICWFALSVVLLANLALAGAPWSPALLQALTLTFFEMMLVTAVALFFSSVSSPLLSAVFTFMVFGIGQMTKWIVDLGSLARDHAPWLESVLTAAYLVLPNLHNFNVRQEAVHAAERGLSAAIPASEMYHVLLYGLSYTAALLLAAALTFRRRNL